MTDGKYCTLTLLKQYIGKTRTDPNDPSVYNNFVTGSPDDTLLSDCILQAEAAFDMVTGTGFDQQTYTRVQSFLTFVDGNGWLHLFARERGPVTAVSAVQVRIIGAGSSTWDTVTWNATDDIVLPPFATSDTYPRPESWHVWLWPAQPLPSCATGQIMARWSYTGGFATIPPSLSLLIAEYANFLYRSREAPIGVTINGPMASMTVPSNVPPEFRKQFAMWTPVYA